MNYLKLIRINIKSVCTEAPYFRPLLSTLVIYLIFVYLLTLNPFRFSLSYFNYYFQFRRGCLATIIGGSSVDDIILNLIMLFPLGLVIGALFRAIQIKVKQSVIIATGVGFFISLSIELCQIFLPRSTSGIDTLTNTIGAGIGAWLAYPIKEFDSQQILKKLYNRGSLFYSRVIMIYCIVATLTLMLPVYFNTFRNWNESYHLLVGNEATLNRAWSGTIYKLSIFNQKFNEREVEQLYAIDFHQETPAELSKGLLIEYIFNNPPVKINGILKDSFVLSPHQRSSFDLNEQGGIILKNDSLICTPMPVTELVHSLKKTNQLSVAICFQPKNLQQDGPARIISLSKDTDHRNFTLGQSGSLLSFRVRTPLIGSNGSKVELITHPILTTDKPQFVIATFHRGESKLFYNGKIVSAIIYNTSHYLPLLIGLGNNRFGKAAFCFMLLFPFGWLARGLVSIKWWKSIVSSIIIIFPFLISSLINNFYFKHTFDLHLFYLCCFISLLLLVIGLIYEWLCTQ